MDKTMIYKRILYYIYGYVLSIYFKYEKENMGDKVLTVKIYKKQPNPVYIKGFEIYCKKQELLIGNIKKSNV